MKKHKQVPEQYQSAAIMLVPPLEENASESAYSAWQERSQFIVKPDPVRLVARLNFEWPLGIDLTRGGISFSADGESYADHLYSTKVSYPRNIVMTRIGEFYEAYGIDAVYVSQYANLAAMGGENLQAKCGCRVESIQFTLNLLTAAGFQVCIIEQSSDSPENLVSIQDETSKKSKKKRYLSAIVGPENPLYTEAVLGSARNNPHSTSAPDSLENAGRPSLALFAVLGGYLFQEINFAVRTYTQSRSPLNFEAVRAKLASKSSGYSYLFIGGHFTAEESSQLKADLHGLASQEGGSRVETSRSQSNSAPTLLDAEYFFDQSRRKLDQSYLTEDKGPWEISWENAREDGQLKALSFLTASQLGIIPSRGIPDLARWAIGKEVGFATETDWMRSLLLRAPTTKAREAIREILSAYDLSTSLPSVRTIPLPSRYIRSIQSLRLSSSMVLDLFSALSFIKDMVITSPSLHGSIVDLALSRCGLSDQGSDGTANALFELYEPLSNFVENSGASLRDNTASIDYARLELNDEMKRYFDSSEYDVRLCCSKKASSTLEALYSDLILSAEVLSAIVTKSLSELGGAAVLKFIDADQSVAISLKKPKKGELSETSTENLIPAKDRYGVRISDKFTNLELETAISKHKAAVGALHIEIRKELDRVAEKLLNKTWLLRLITEYLVSHRSLLLHHAFSKRMRLCQPQFASIQEKAILTEVRPYWLSEGVSNSLTIKDTEILMGSNAAGKSTLLRSTAAGVLLSMCGLNAPSESITISTISPPSGIYLRTGSADNPLSGLSSHALEMTELTAILSEADCDSIVMLDEIGRGCPTHSGASIAGAIFKHLHTRNIPSIFATHWSEIFKLGEPVIDQANSFHMAVSNGKPTFIRREGRYLDSLAIEVAIQVGLNSMITDEAKAFEERLTGIIQKPVDITMAQNENFIERLAKTFSLEFFEVAPGHIPLGSALDSSVVYVLSLKNGLYYIGETDNLSKRLEQHRRDPIKEGCHCFFAAIPKGKSKSRSMETSMIKFAKLIRADLLSDFDSNHESFG